MIAFFSIGRLRRTLFAFALLALPAEAHAQWFSGIGDVVGGTFDSNAYAVSNDGLVVAETTGEIIWELPGYPPLVVNGTRGALWNLTGLQLLPEEMGAAIDISADGSVVMGWTSAGSGLYAVYLWTAAGGVVEVTLGAGDNLPRELSEDGTTIVGRGVNDAGTRSEAFRWSAAGGFEKLGALPHTNPRSEAWGVSADGRVVAGTSSNYANAPGFRWEEGQGMAPIGALTEVPRAVSGVSGDGQTVFGQEKGNSFLWTAAGGYVFLGNTFEVGVPKLVRDVSHDGSRAVGGNSATTVSSAFFWDPVSGMRPLAEVLTTDFGIDLTGWTLLQANGISPNGLYVVGEAINPAGDREGFVAYLGTSAVGSCGLGVELAFVLPALLLARRRRGCLV